jgi:hypothetical protein
MNRKMVVACHSILDNFTKDEVDEIVEILKHYNSLCKEESRAACLAKGCQNDNSSIERKISLYRDSSMTIERFSKSAGASYSGPTRTTCSKCGAPL